MVLSILPVADASQFLLRPPHLPAPYSTFKEGFEAIQSFAFHEGYAVTAYASSNADKDGPRRFDIQCARSGINRSTSKGIRKSWSRRTGCPFRMKITRRKELNNMWQAHVIRPEHNHLPSEPKFFPEHRARAKEMEKLEERRRRQEEEEAGGMGGATEGHEGETLEIGGGVTGETDGKEGGMMREILRQMGEMRKDMKELKDTIHAMQSRLSPLQGAHPPAHPHPHPAYPHGQPPPPPPPGYNAPPPGYGPPAQSYYHPSSFGHPPLPSAPPGQHPGYGQEPRQGEPPTQGQYHVWDHRVQSQPPRQDVQAQQPAHHESASAQGQLPPAQRPVQTQQPPQQSQQPQAQQLAADRPEGQDEEEESAAD